MRIAPEVAAPHDEQTIYLERCPSCSAVLYTVTESSVTFTISSRGFVSLKERGIV